jgi:uncharacterized membrane protein YeaQ/YmgE (transglycosylase-associated protein family)
MNILWAIIIGFISGAIAKLVMPEKDPGGFILTTLLGIIGATVSTWLGRLLGFYGPNEGVSLIAAVTGAAILIAIYHLIRPRHTTV